MKKLKCIFIDRKPAEIGLSAFPSYDIHTALIHLHFVGDARGHLQCSMGLCVLFKGIAGENFRSNTSILQLPAHSQRTPLSVAGINPTTFGLLVSLYIQANLGRGGGWAGGLWDGSQVCVCRCVRVCVCVRLSGWGCCFPSVRSTLHLPRPLSDRPTYITTPNTSVSLSSPSSSSLFPLSLPPSIQLSSQPLLSPAPISHECWCLSQLPTALSLSLSFSHFHLLAAPPPPTHLPEYHLHRWCLIITPALLYLSPSSSGACSCAVGLIPVVYQSGSEAATEPLTVVFTQSAWSLALRFIMD